jgi:hypothetical protein
MPAVLIEGVSEAVGVCPDTFCCPVVLGTLFSC